MPTGKLPLSNDTSSLVERVCYVHSESFAVRSGDLNPGLLLEKFSPNPRRVEEETKRLEREGGQRKAGFYASWAKMAVSGQTIREAAAGAIKRRDAQMTMLRAAGQEVETLKAQVIWRLIVGLGNSHPLETSLTLHSLYGYPFLPGSAVKGLTRHFRLWRIGQELAMDPVSHADFKDRTEKSPKPYNITPLAKLDALMTMPPSQEMQKEREKMLHSLQADALIQEKTKLLAETLQSIEAKFGNLYRRVFGAQTGQGKVIFYDALPLKWSFEPDVMTPHYSDYYGKQETPSDTMNPIPIVFLTLGRESRFRFDLTSREIGLTQEAREWLLGALQTFGAGGKTAAGYGEMQEV